MNDYSDIVEKRAIPGILVFDMENRLIFLNDEAAAIFPDPNLLPDSIYTLCENEKKRMASGVGRTAGSCALVHVYRESVYCIRAAALKCRGEGIDPHVMVLIEGIVDKHCIDFEKARRDFNLTNREIDVLKHLCRGLNNKEIADMMYISEYTAKDHVKSIMRKMGSKSRNEIISALK